MKIAKKCYVTVFAAPDIRSCFNLEKT